MYIGFSPTLFNIYTADTITSTHTSTSVAKKYIQPYLLLFYIPPASFCMGGYLPSLDHLMMMTDTIILGDFNAHHSAWYSSSILRIHVTSPILGEHISAITLTQQCKQWLSVELNCWRSERIHCYVLNNKNRTLIIIM